MSEEKMAIATEQDVVDFILAALAQNAITPTADQFFKPGTLINLNLYGVQLPLKIGLRSTAEAAQTSAIDGANEAAGKLGKRISHYLNTLNGHVDDGDYLPGVRSFYDLDIATGNHYDMDTIPKVISAAGKIATGDAAMVAAGNVQIVDFSAAGIAALLVILNTKVGIMNASKMTHNDAIGAVGLIFPLALATAKQGVLEVENNYNHMDGPAMRTYTRLWGVKYETAKVTTDIKIICIMPDGTTRAAGAELRVGPILTAEKKPSKEGAKGTADAEGEDILTTTQAGDQFVNARMMGCADAAVPVTIVPGAKQTITVHFVVGVSTL